MVEERPPGSLVQRNAEGGDLLSRRFVMVCGRLFIHNKTACESAAGQRA
jgi:hypothetical protein